jgi:glycosyltransferase involved in cell wall biosynthesis
MDLLFSKRTILKYARRFDKCIMVSEHDGDTLKRAGPDIDIAVVPNGVDATAYRPLTNQSAAPVLLFVGKMNYHPNVDGAIFFCQEVFPLIKQQIPDAKLLIVGSEPRDSVQALASEDVTVTGFVESVVPYYQQALVSVVPLRSGGGTRLKILESMALGRPVVSTSLGCEGLKVTQEENILIADTPADFVTQTVRLLRDEALRQRLITNGRNLVEGTYDWQAITQQLLHLYSETINKQQNRRFIN